VLCPRGAVAMEYMYDTYPTRFIGVAVHNGDPMTVTEYDDGANLSGFPGCNVDRALKDESVSKTLFEGYYNARKDLTIPASIAATATWNGANVSVAVTSTFKTVFANANYRLGVIMIEDNVTGTGTAYNQANAYAGGTNGVMGGFESLPNPVPAAQMVYDHVGRALIGGYAGQAGSVPATITNNQAVNYTFNYTVPATSKRYLMSAVAVLIDNTTGEIINATKVALTAAGVEEVASIGMAVYPNPASGSVNVKFDATGADYAVAITDLAGRQVAAKTITNANGAQSVEMPIEGLATGNYLVTVSTNGASFTQNLMVK
ncbi:MAG: Omp28-related outer membrane protein, partial [Crocinitomicaceae bacterium]|nr:Omp28-related outer membrane protein [Crocinitomicaceae bacterium]